MKASIIIPVFNQWEWTRACLKAVAATTRGCAAEVLVVDNASTDVTPRACQDLGRRLFGPAFQYHRFPVNRNFGPACNAGAKLARGEYLVFLNNDTVPLPGWLEPLFDDFSTWTNIAATGPLLLYPWREPFGYSVQHLGVFLSAFGRVGHLYEGIPAQGPLVCQRRFFQIITAACMMMPRALFEEVGGFDEHYINGFEDVDLGARLTAKGYKMTVNPMARVVHHTSQTPGRSVHERANFDYFTRHSLGLLTSDHAAHVERDGMFLRLGPWQKVQASLPDRVCRQLNTAAAAATPHELKKLIADYPFWENGWRMLIGNIGAGPERDALRSTLLRLYPCPTDILESYRAAVMAGERRTAASCLSSLIPFCESPEAYVEIAQMLRQWCDQIGLKDLAAQYARWTEQAKIFEHEKLRPFFADFWHVLATTGFAMPFQVKPHAAWLETVRRYGERS